MKKKKIEKQNKMNGSTLIQTHIHTGTLSSQLNDERKTKLKALSTHFVITYHSNARLTLTKTHKKSPKKL